MSCLILAAACTAAPTPTPSPWNPAITLTQTPQSDAPALVVRDGRVTAAWIGSDARGVHQDARAFTGGSLGNVITLPLPPTHPYAQQMFPAPDGGTHLLWLDADENDQMALYSALLTVDLTVERGSVSVSDGLALDYAAISDGAGGVWAVWSGGLLSEMSLYARRIDDNGRPLQKMTLASDATDPALVRTREGEIWVFWLENGQVMRQQLDPQTTAAPQAITSTVSLKPGDRLINVQAALDDSSAYFFWNITRANGVEETWLTSGLLTTDSWQPPARLEVGGGALRWTAPLPDQQASLLAAAESDGGLGIATLHGGQVVDYQIVVPEARLIGLPLLRVDANGGLYLAWAEPGETAADLRVIARRR